MRLLTALLFCCLSVLTHAQPITGVWRGRVSRGLTSYKVEVKLVMQGDSLKGTSYYYANASHYFRYAVKGYTDPVDGSLHWWDDELLEKKGGNGLPAVVNQQPLQLQADFNCPGAGIMKLDGQAATSNGKDFELHMDKQEGPLFADDWDELITSWHYGGADPEWVAQVDAGQRTKPLAPPPAKAEPPARQPDDIAVNRKPSPAAPKPKPVPSESQPSAAAELPQTRINEPPAKPLVPAPLPPAPRPLTLQEKQDTRLKTVQATLPLEGDSIELQFFDNAEIDGDSIALFLNGRLLFEHVKLSAEPFVMKMAVADLPADAELSMVAENLGAIPPNTSFMMAYINGERYTARLESTEKTTAVIRFKRE